MSLNIKNEVVHDLVREAAARTGRSQTSVVEIALRRYLDELAAQDDAAEAERQRRIDDIVAVMRREWRESTAEPFAAEDLYDPVTGLPG